MDTYLILQIILPAKFNCKAKVCIKKPLFVDSKKKLVGYLVINFSKFFFETYVDVLLKTKFLSIRPTDSVYLFRYTIKNFLS
jgi:hypothetical protein